jgi:sugar phosphate permease
MIFVITITIIFSSKTLGPLALSYSELYMTRYSIHDWKICMRNQPTEHYHMITQEEIIIEVLNNIRTHDLSKNVA